MPVEEKHNVSGGRGKITFTYMAPNETLQNARLIAELALEPGAVFGPHSHENETAYYLIVNGIGLVNDGKSERTVRSGDIVICGNGSSHSIENIGKRNLFFHAVIITH
jgi:mannose-6-phosphate isomerase-like protein (cupin superfamily)